MNSGIIATSPVTVLRNISPMRIFHLLPIRRIVLRRSLTRSSDTRAWASTKNANVFSLTDERVSQEGRILFGPSNVSRLQVPAASSAQCSPARASKSPSLERREPLRCTASSAEHLLLEEFTDNAVRMIIEAAYSRETSLATVELHKIDARYSIRTRGCIYVTTS